MIWRMTLDGRGYGIALEIHGWSDGGGTVWANGDGGYGYGPVPQDAPSVYDDQNMTNGDESRA